MKGNNQNNSHPDFSAINIKREARNPLMDYKSRSKSPLEEQNKDLSDPKYNPLMRKFNSRKTPGKGNKKKSLTPKIKKVKKINPVRKENMRPTLSSSKEIQKKKIKIRYDENKAVNINNLNPYLVHSNPYQNSQKFYEMQQSNPSELFTSSLKKNIGNRKVFGSLRYDGVKVYRRESNHLAKSLIYDSDKPTTVEGYRATAGVYRTDFSNVETTKSRSSYRKMSVSYKNIYPSRSIVVSMMMLESVCDDILNFGLRNHYLKMGLVSILKGINQARKAKKVSSLSNFFKIVSLPKKSEKKSIKKVKKNGFGLIIDSTNQPDSPVEYSKLKSIRSCLESPENDVFDKVLRESEIKMQPGNFNMAPKRSPEGLSSSPLGITSPDQKTKVTDIRITEIDFFDSGSKLETKNKFDEIFNDKFDVSFEKNEMNSKGIMETAAFNSPEDRIDQIVNPKYGLSNFDLHDTRKFEYSFPDRLKLDKKRAKKKRKKTLRKGSSFNKKTLKFFKENSRILREFGNVDEKANLKRTKRNLRLDSDDDENEYQFRKSNSPRKLKTKRTRKKLKKKSPYFSKGKLSKRR